MTLEVVCPQCRKLHAFSDVVPFRAECDACAADLHVCLSCRFHDRYVENECREDQADPVAQKDRRNLCEYWKPIAPGATPHDEATRARARLDALFGGAPAHTAAPPSPAHGDTRTTAADEARRKLDELFRKKP